MYRAEWMIASLEKYRGLPTQKLREIRNGLLFVKGQFLHDHNGFNKELMMTLSTHIENLLQIQDFKFINFNFWLEADVEEIHEIKGDFITFLLDESVGSLSTDENNERLYTYKSSFTTGYYTKYGSSTDGSVYPGDLNLSLEKYEDINSVKIDIDDLFQIIRKETKITKFAAFLCGYKEGGGDGYDDGDEVRFNIGWEMYFESPRLALQHINDIMRRDHAATTIQKGALRNPNVGFSTMKWDPY